MKNLLFNFTEAGVRGAFSEIVRKITVLERRGETDTMAPKRFVLPREKPQNPTDGTAIFTGTKIEVWSSATAQWIEV